MPALDFPSSPTNGQVFGQYVYDSTKGAWRVSAELLASATPSPTAPINPVSGDLWFNTNDGVMFMYLNDGNSSQWVEVKSNTASGSTVAARVDAIEAKPNGLVPTVPSSIALGSGTGSVGLTGAASFSLASSVSINNCFSSTYTNYRIMLNITGSSITGNAIYIRLRSAGSDNSSSYQWIAVNNYFNGIRMLGNSGITYAEIGYTGAGDTSGFAVVEIASPFLVAKTYATMSRTYNNENTVGGWWHNFSGSFDGFTLIPSGGNITGTVQVYGYR